MIKFINKVKAYLKQRKLRKAAQKQTLHRVIGDYEAFIKMPEPVPEAITVRRCGT